MGALFDPGQLGGFWLTPNAQVLRWVMQKACKSVTKARTFAHKFGTKLVQTRAFLVFWILKLARFVRESWFI